MDFVRYMEQTGAFESQLENANRLQLLAKGAQGVAGVTKGRTLRREDRARERERERERRFFSNRDLEPPPPPEEPPAEDPSAALRRRLKEWQLEKERKRQSRPKPPPPFKVGLAPSVLPLPPPALPNRRETRASRKAALAVEASKKVAPSLAPPGTKFHPPKMPKVATPKNRYNSSRKGSMFNKLFFNKPSSASKINRNKSKNTPRKIKPSTKASTKLKSKRKGSGIESPNFQTLTNMEKEKHKSPVDRGIPKEKPVTPASVVENFQVSSPFVTLSRGKKRLTDFELQALKPTPEKSAANFRYQLNEEISRLNDVCEIWKKYQKDNAQLDEDHHDMINVAIGQTQLLISKKFQQFRGLIDRCESQDIREGEGLVKIEDLQGFWDMVYMQVENLDIRFKELDDLKSKNWKDDPVSLPSVKVIKVNKPPPKIQTKSSGLRAKIQAARLKNKSVKLLSSEENVKTFDAGFFSVTSPARKSIDREISRSSMRNSVISSEMKRKMTPQSAAAILSVASLEKQRSKAFKEMTLIDLNKTPGKSILKTPGSNKKYVSEKSVKLIVNGDFEINVDNESTLDKLDTVNSSAELQTPEKTFDNKTNLIDTSKPSALVDENENSGKKSKRKRKSPSNSNSKKPKKLSEGSLPARISLTEPLKELSPNINIKTLRSSSANIMTEKNRKSYNLISFESPVYSAPVTRSVARKLSNLFVVEE